MENAAGPKKRSSVTPRRLIAAGLVLAAALAVWMLAFRETTPAVAYRPLTASNTGEPRSLPAVTGKAYRYDSGHCGLGFVIDFDGSFWDVDEATLTEDENARFGINNDAGTITLLDEDSAIYRSARGGSAELRRRTGEAEPKICG